MKGYKLVQQSTSMFKSPGCIDLLSGFGTKNLDGENSHFRGHKHSHEGQLVTAAVLFDIFLMCVYFWPTAAL